MNQLFKKHRAKIFSGIVLGAVAAMAVVLLKNTSPLFSNNIDAANDYTIQLNSTNGSAGFSSSYSSSEQINNSSRTSKGNPIRLTYKNVKKTANKFAVMANGGYFYNPTGYQIIGLETINVTFTGGSLSLYSSKTNDFSGSATSLTSGTQVSIKANYDYFKIVSTNETTIDNIVMTYTCAPRQEDITDVITAADLAATTTSYADFTGVKKSSSARYAGNSAKNSSGHIQLRSKNSSGICSSISGGDVSSVTITVGSGSNQIDIYGSNKAYTNAGDLYNSSTQGTLVGSVTSTGTVSFTDSYKYLGIRSNNGAIYISKIEITWNGGDTPTPPTPSGDLPTGTYTASLGYENPIPATVDIVNNDEQKVSTLVISTSSGFSYKTDYETYYLGVDEYFEFTNSTNAKITKVSIEFYKYYNFDLYIDGTSVFSGDGSQAPENNYTEDFTDLNGSSTVKILCNGGGGTYKQQIYSVVITLEVSGPVSVTGVSLNKTSLTLAEEASETLVATVLPSGATNKKVTWTASNSTVASVDQNGKVTANEAGNATITVETEDGSFTATCEVTVTAVYHVTGVALNKTQLNLNVGASETLTPTISPSNATDKSVTWSSSNSSVASVSNGTVTAVAAGSATITVKTNDGNKTATCAVTVSEVAVTSVTLSKTSTTLVRGGSETLTATVLPANATNKNITWSSSNSSVASVSNGTVTAVAAGSATITATSQADSNKKASCTVTVNPKGVISISLNKTELALNVDQSDTLTVTFNPTDADDQLITWSTSNSSIATVSNGTVTAKAVGSATITATSHDGNKTATCAVTVTEAPQETTYEFTNKDWNATPQNWTCGQAGAGFSNGGVQVTSNASGANATSPESFTGVKEVVVSYCTNTSKGVGSILIQVGSQTLDNEKEVTKEGGTTPRDLTFTGNGSLSGNIKITVTCTTNSIYICAVTIKTANIVATGVTLPNSINVGIDSHAKITPTYTPAGANKGTALTWEKRSGSSTITVDQSGTVYVSSEATTSHSAVIRATLQSDSTKYSECTVQVVESIKDAHTILIYLCGSDLESGSGHYGTSDINEILSASGQPDNVNVVIETGGANRNSTYFSKTLSQRWHLSNKTLVKDESFAIRNMGESSTLQSFIEYGLNEYPAEKTGLILWNHGGGISGVCVDEIENHTDNHDQKDRLTAAEVASAVSGALSNCQMSGQKLEWIGYDACLMGVADIASVNADCFNYMVGSEELEGGPGWNYDEWLKTLFSQPSETTTILDTICKTFVSDSGTSSDNDSTLAAYDLSKMPAFTSAFNTWSNNFTKNSWSKLKTIYQSSLRFGDQYHQGENLNGAVDAKDFINKIKQNSSFSSISNTALLAALDDLVISNQYGPYYSNITIPCGITMFFAGDESIPTGEEGYVYPPQHYKDQYSENDTKFSHWRDLNTANGEWNW